ncbi:Cell division and transport-associated protein TolQ (TC 2.C.1.2.1) [Ancylobacter rudongensis]|uniref:Tol-Pal system protein TolQ n=2 Tax=Ancylobacter rudongensis TaxID=177413 RepID=A0A1G4TWN6_9HYPH|nr:Cell division and transport-associated protein TolQ (TC 2.C.1.2.1) [Ancylobacter rudongensis]
MTLKKLLFAVMLVLAAPASMAIAQNAPVPVTAAPTAQVDGQAVAAPDGMVSSPAGAGMGSADLSLIGLFLQAHLIVKFVMAGLVLASVWVWAIIIDKTILYGRMKRQMDRFETTFWSGQSLEELYRSLSSRQNHAMAAIFVAAMREWKRSYEGGARSLAGLTQRLDKVMNVTIAREVERLENRLLVLATVGSAGPFIGLFGTVWGIMTSFQSIAASKNTSLAVVAPGIAEALFATAIGLIAAIPATIFYNKFVSQVNRQAARLEGFADEFSAILSRQIDERG